MNKDNQLFSLFVVIENMLFVGYFDKAENISKQV